MTPIFSRGKEVIVFAYFIIFYSSLFFYCETLDEMG